MNLRQSMALASVGIATFIPISAWAQPKVNPADGQTAVPVRKVVLYSSGVGYFEHAGFVKGNAQTELRFKTRQINDILKSLVFQDLAGGKVGTIAYPSQDPISKTLRSFQIDITTNPPLADILNQLRGASVKLSMQGEKTSGIIVGAEQRPKAAGDKAVVNAWFINLITDAGIRSFPVESIINIELEDANLQKELKQALAALSQARDQDKKPVTINFTGEGERPVRLAYVVETPIWKTSYRLILGEDVKDKKAPGKLQGWAIVENQTDNDWSDINLSLVSGRPISFIEELYQPLYVARPVVKPELFASLTPQTYGEGMTSGGAPAADLPDADLE